MPISDEMVLTTFPDGRDLLLNLSDDTQRQIFFNAFEPHETRLFLDCLRPGDTCIDVGAHIGWFTTLAGREVRSGGRVYAFEAFPPNAEQLTFNVAVNHLENVVVSPIAVSDRTGELTVGIQPGGDSGSPTAGPRSSERQTVVRTGALDAELPANLGIRLLKIDVEGFEEHVLVGARGTLDRTEFVLVELNRSALESNSSSPERIVAMLSASGFSYQYTVGGRGRHNGEMECLPAFTNLLASRRSLARRRG